MAYPTSGPTISLASAGGDIPGNFRRYRAKYKQAKPYGFALTYEMHNLYCSVAQKSTWGDTSIFFGGFADVNTGKSPYFNSVQPDMISLAYADERSMAINTAIAEFRQRLSESAELAVNLAERKQAMDMITNRAHQLFSAARALRRGGPFAFLSELKITPDSSTLRKARKDHRKWKRSKDFSNLWLEYHFGWSPLVKDIGNAVDFLQGPIPMGPISAKGRRVSLDFSEVVSDSTDLLRSTTTRNIKGWIQCKVGGQVHMTNSDLFLANRMGFTNPFVVAWELVPFSFVVDWFVNVSDVLRNFDGYVGIDIKEPYHTVVASIPSCDYRVSNSILAFFSPPPRFENVASSYMNIVTHGFWMKRTLGIPAVTLGVRPPWRLSASRAITAISLLVQKGLR